MTNQFLSSITYIVRTRFCEETQEFQKTEFSSDNSLAARNNAFKFIESYLEIIANEGLVQISSDIINSHAIKRFNKTILKPSNRTYKRIKLFNQEVISIIPNQKIFPKGIRLSFRINLPLENEKNEEFEIFSFQKPNHTIINQQLNHLILENTFLNYMGYHIDEEIVISKNEFKTLSIEPVEFKIIDTPYKWENETRRFSIDYLTDKHLFHDGLQHRLSHHEMYHYISFLERNCIEEIEKNVYSMLHSTGGLLYIGYHPENIVESAMNNEEIIDYYQYLNHTFSQDKYLFKNIYFDLINYLDFPVLAIVVYPLNLESKKRHAYNRDKIFVRQNNTFFKIKDS